MIDPQKTKYHGLYWDMAWAAAAQSVAMRHKVGAVVVTPTGMISIGWNGMPAGLPNRCEDYEVWDTLLQMDRLKTNPQVIHAERNALDKMIRQGVPTEGCILFITRSPCFECAKSLCGLGLTAIYMDERHDCRDGLKLLADMGVHCYWRNHEQIA